jgi:hypothetical protein
MDGTGRRDVSAAGRVFLEFPAQGNLILWTLPARLIRPRVQQFSKSPEDNPDHPTQQRNDDYQAEEPKDNAEHRLI